MKKGIMIVALLSLFVACGGDSPTAPSYMAPPSGGSTTGQMCDLFVDMPPHRFDALRCDAVTVVVDDQHKGVLKKSWRMARVHLEYPEGSVHTLRAVTCHD